MSGCAPVRCTMTPKIGNSETYSARKDCHNCSKAQQGVTHATRIPRSLLAKPAIVPGTSLHTKPLPSIPNDRIQDEDKNIDIHDTKIQNRYEFQPNLLSIATHSYSLLALSFAISTYPDATRILRGSPIQRGGINESQACKPEVQTVADP